MNRFRSIVFVWAIYVAFIALYIRPWATGWSSTFYGLAIALAVTALFHILDFFAAKPGIGEARFDSETSKLLPPFRGGE